MGLAYASRLTLIRSWWMRAETTARPFAHPRLSPDAKMLIGERPDCKGNWQQTKSVSRASSKRLALPGNGEHGLQRRRPLALRGSRASKGNNFSREPKHFVALSTRIRPAWTCKIR